MTGFVLVEVVVVVEAALVADVALKAHHHLGTAATVVVAARLEAAVAQ